MGSDPNPLVYVSLFLHAKIILRCQNMFYKSGAVISDQFEHLNMFSFLGNSEKWCRGGGGSPIPTSLLVKTKNAPKALKRKINL